MAQRSEEDRKLTRPFGHIYAEAVKKARGRLEELSDEELHDTKWAVDRLAPANCWWAEYRMRDEVLEIIRDIEDSRQAFTDSDDETK